MVGQLLAAVKAHAFGDKRPGSFYDAVGGRIYSPAAPDNAEFPMAVFVSQGLTRPVEYMDAGDVPAAQLQLSLRWLLYSDRKYDDRQLCSLLKLLQERFDWQMIQSADGEMTPIECQPDQTIGPERIDDRLFVAQDYNLRVEV